MRDGIFLLRAFDVNVNDQMRLFLSMIDGVFLYVFMPIKIHSFFYEDSYEREEN